MTTVIVITAKRNGFRRCGVAHSDQPTTWQQDDFTDGQWEELIKEPQLFLAVEERNLDLGLEQHHAFTSSITLQEATSTAQSDQSQALEANTAALGITAVPPVASVLGNDEPGQDQGQLTAVDINLDALWDEACQEDLAREATKAQAAKPSGKLGKAKVAKAEGDDK